MCELVSACVCVCVCPPMCAFLWVHVCMHVFILYPFIHLVRFGNSTVGWILSKGACIKIFVLPNCLDCVIEATPP